MFIRTAIIAASTFWVTACVSDPTTLGAPYSSVAPNAQIEKMFVATNRAHSAVENAMFSEERSEDISYSRVDVFIPEERKLGVVQRAKAALQPNAERHMATVGRRKYETIDEFSSDIEASLDHRLDGEREILIFVHGFNNSYADTVYRGAQFRHDLDMQATLVQFSWPSAGQITGYPYDKDSVLFSRDALEEFLRSIEDIDSDSIVLMAHSMGAQLTMETLRQSSLKKETQLFDKLSMVVLVAPDIDQDVFRTQIETLTPLPFPMVVMISRDDQALRFSSFIQRDQRLGRGADIEELQSLGFIVVDMTNLEDGDSANHSKFAESPAFISLVRNRVFSPEFLSENQNATSGVKVSTGVEDEGYAIVYFPKPGIAGSDDLAY